MPGGKKSEESDAYSLVYYLVTKRNNLKKAERGDNYTQKKKRWKTIKRDKRRTETGRKRSKLKRQGGIDRRECAEALNTGDQSVGLPLTYLHSRNGTISAGRSKQQQKKKKDSS